MEEKKNYLDCDTWAELKTIEQRLLLLTCAMYHIGNGGGGTPSTEFNSASDVADACHGELMAIYTRLRDTVEKLRKCGD